MIVAFTVMGLDLDALFHKRRPRTQSISESEASFDSHDGDVDKAKAATASPPSASSAGWPQRWRPGWAGSGATPTDVKVPMQELARPGLTTASLAQHELETNRAEAAAAAAASASPSDDGGHTPGAAALGLESFTFGCSPPTGARPPISLQGPMDIGSDDDEDEERDIDRARLHASLRRSFASSATGPSTGEPAAENAEAGPSRPVYNLPSVLPPSSAMSNGPSTLVPPFNPADSAALESGPSRASSASPSRQLRSDLSSGIALLSTPTRGRQPAASAPATPTSGRSSRRRLSHPVGSRPTVHAPLAIKDQMTFEEFENSALGGGRLALIRGSESSQGSSNLVVQRRHSTTSTLERPASERSRRPSAFTNNSGLQGDGGRPTTVVAAHLRRQPSAVTPKRSKGQLTRPLGPATFTARSTVPRQRPPIVTRRRRSLT